MVLYIHCRCFQVVPLVKVRLDDVLNREHLPPLGVYFPSLLSPGA